VKVAKAEHGLAYQGVRAGNRMAAAWRAWSVLSDRVSGRWLGPARFTRVL